MKNLLNRSIIVFVFSLFFLSIGIDGIFAYDSDFQIDENGVLVKYTGSDTHIVIPNSVTSIGDSVFYTTNIVSVRIPNSVTSIGDFAFAYCRQLTTVNIPDSVTDIGEQAFVFCEKLADINIPNSITNFKPFVFAGCYSLTDFTIPDSITTIESDAFSFNNFVSIDIPASVNNLHHYAFSGCRKLGSVNVSDSNPNYKDIEGVLFNRNETELIFYPMGRINSEYTIPDSVISICERAFEDCKNLTKINISNSLTNIGEFTFAGCENLISISIPNSVTSIGKRAFSGCYALKGIDIADSVTNISESAFSGCYNLISLNIPISVTNIKESAFAGCSKLESAFIYNKNIEFGKTVFGEINPLIILYGYKDSTTEAYASQNGYKFQDLENQDKPLVSISLAKTNINLIVGKSTLNSVIYNPADTTDDKTVKWSSSDSSVARVLTNGKIQALSKGSAIITARVGDLIATCNVTIN